MIAAKQTSTTMKDKQTAQSIKHSKPEKQPWGFSISADDELSIYKLAYMYRNSQHGLTVEYAPVVGKWMITVFNKHGKELGLDGAK